MSQKLTLLEELATIDEAMLEGTATDEQEARGQQLVILANAAPAMLQALREVHLALKHHRHWQPTMPTHLTGIIQAAIDNATNLQE